MPNIRETIQAAVISAVVALIVLEALRTLEKHVNEIRRNVSDDLMAAALAIMPAADREEIFDRIDKATTAIDLRAVAEDINTVKGENHGEPV